MHPANSTQQTLSHTRARAVVLVAWPKILPGIAPGGDWPEKSEVASSARFVFLDFCTTASERKQSDVKNHDANDVGFSPQFG